MDNDHTAETNAMPEGKPYSINARIERSLRRFTARELLEYCESRIIGQHRELERAVFSVYCFLRNTVRGKSAENWMLIAPSGSGKTEFYRAVRDFFRLKHIPVPVVQIDLSQITETGFKGRDVDLIPQRILREQRDCGGIAVCFLDEADKKCLPSFDSSGIDVHKAVQADLLTLIEGHAMKIVLDGKTFDYDSDRTMFVLMGAFQSVRNDRRTGSRKQLLGFGIRTETSMDDILYADITMDDIISCGMIEELAGRMTQVINFHKLSEADMRRVILSKVRTISDDTGIKIEIEKSAVEELLPAAFGDLGVRAPMNKIRELAQRTAAGAFFDGAFDMDRDTVVITGSDSAKIRRTDLEEKDH